MKPQTPAAPEYRGSMPRSTQELAQWQTGAPATPIVEPELPIVDAHHHLFGTPQDRQHYLLDGLQRDLSSGHRVIATVYVEAYGSGWRSDGPEALRPVGETETIVGRTLTPLATPNGPCQVAAGIVAYADLLLGDAVEPVLAAHREAARGRLCGVRYRTATDDGALGRFIAERPRPGLLLDPAVQRACALLGRQDLSFDAWVYHHQIHEVVALADACPHTRIVVDHVGGVIGVLDYVARQPEVQAAWRADLRALAARPNVHMKIGGLGMPMFGFGFEHGDAPATASALVRAWQPAIDACIEAFGPARCMFESNFPVDKQSCSYAEMWNAYKLATRTLSAPERQDLFSGTACRTYRLRDVRPPHPSQEIA